MYILAVCTTKTFFFQRVARVIYELKFDDTIKRASVDMCPGPE